MTPTPLKPAPAVASPCVNTCRMNAATGLCEGCQRTLDEIAAWAQMGDAQRREVLGRVEARRAGAHGRAGADAT